MRRRRRIILGVLVAMIVPLGAAIGTFVALRNAARRKQLDAIVASIRSAESSSEEEKAIAVLWSWFANRRCLYDLTLIRTDTGEQVSDENLDRVRAPVEVRLTVREMPSSWDYFRYKCRFVVRDPMNLYLLFRFLPPTPLLLDREW